MKILRNTAQFVETRTVRVVPNKRDPLTLDVIDHRTGTRLAEEVLRTRLDRVLKDNGWEINR